MRVTIQKEEAAARSKIAASLQITYPLTVEGEQGDSSSPAEALQRGFQALGLSLHELFADELAITGPGFPARMVPDRRTAHCLLRQLRGAM